MFSSRKTQAKADKPDNPINSKFIDKPKKQGSPFSPKKPDKPNNLSSPHTTPNFFNQIRPRLSVKPNNFFKLLTHLFNLPKNLINFAKNPSNFRENLESIIYHSKTLVNRQRNSINHSENSGNELRNFVDPHPPNKKFLRLANYLPLSIAIKNHRGMQISAIESTNGRKNERKNLREIVLFVRKFPKQIPPSLKSLLPLLVIFFLPIIFFWSSFIGKTIILAGDFTGSDLVDLHYPFKFALSQAIKSGQLPLWSPELGNGFPLLAEGQSGILYPPNLLFALFPPHMALNYSLILAFILAGSFTYLYALSLGYPPFPALSSAVVFMFSAFFVTRIKHLNLIAAACWLPFLFLSARRFFQTGHCRYSLMTGLGIALMFLAGHPQIAYYCLIIFLVYYIFETFIAASRSGWPAVFPQAVSALFLAALLAFGLSAVQILPTLELAAMSERPEFNFAAASAYPFHPKNLISFISPFYFGNPAAGTYREDIRSTGIYWENASYIGLLPAVLLPWVILDIIRRKDKNPHRRFFLFLAVFSLLLMLGRFTPVFFFFWSHLPGFSLFRFPTRFNLFLIFSLALLAGNGLRRLAEKLEENYHSSPAPPQSAPAELRLSWPLNKLKTEVLFFAFLVLDLTVFAKNYLGKIETERLLAVPETAELLKEDGRLFRLWSLSQYFESPYQTLGWKNHLDPLVAIRLALPANNHLLYHLSSFSDRGWFEGGLSLARRNRLERYLLSEETDSFHLGKILGLANVKYLLTFNSIDNPEMPLVKEVNLGKEFGTSLKIYKNNQVLPRVFFVPEAKVISDQNALFTELIADSFYPPRTVLLEKAPTKTLPEFNGNLEDFQKENRLEIQKYAPSEIIIAAELKNDGFLILSDSFYPGWKAAVDNREAEIFAANFLFRGLQLEPGRHLIRFYYDPLPFKIGAVLFFATILTLSGLFLIFLFKQIVFRPKAAASKNK